MATGKPDDAEGGSRILGRWLGEVARLAVSTPPILQRSLARIACVDQQGSKQKSKLRPAFAGFFERFACGDQGLMGISQTATPKMGEPKSKYHCSASWFQLLGVTWMV